MATLDTLQDSVNSLTSSTTTLVSEVQTKKATLDASVADAEAAQTGAQSARDTASAHKLAAEAAATSATNTASALTGFDLSAIDDTITDNAVDVFVYDTSKDSDGGAWRKRTQGTSWYNETLNTATRGSRKEFPAVAVIVAESNQVTIYDGDDPSLPMWMVFELNGITNGASFVNTGVGIFNYSSYQYTVTSISMRNGRLAFSISRTAGVIEYGMWDVSLISETSKIHLRYPASAGTQGVFQVSGNIAQRNSTDFTVGASKYASSGIGGGIVGGNGNDVAMTVLPNAPIDAATGLPVPTIAVATAGGLSVITDSGAVYDSESTTVMQDVAFDDDNTVYYMRGLSSYALFMAETSDYTSGDGFGTTIASTGLGSQEFDLISDRSQTTTAFGKSFVASGGVSSSTTARLLGLYAVDKANLTNTMAAGIHFDYNTGWMNGDIKLATLSDTDDTDVTGSELVTNGTFDSNTSGWSANGGATLSVVSNTLKVENNGSYGGAFYTVATVVGQVYTLSFDLVEKSGGNDLNTFNLPDGTFVPTSGVGTYAATFTATSTSSNITAAIGGNTVGHFKRFDNISVRLAEEDRSVNGNGLQVFGTVTKNPVNSGADLVAYSGFGPSNYLEQPYNADLDFGTGDFCIMGWFKDTNTTAADSIYDRRDITPATGNGLYLRKISGGVIHCGIYNSGLSVTGTRNVANGVWSHVVMLRSSGIVYVYVNGEFDNSTTITSSVTNTTAVSRFGILVTTSNALDTGSLALWRISATAPTAEQIAKIYEDEKVLFQENAQATLYGSSDAVTALAYDDTTELLHVGTSGGRSVFQGLRRVENTTDAVGTAISASNGLVVEE